MYLAPFSSIRKLSDSPLSANSASAVARCRQAPAKYCCCSKRALRAQSHRLTTGTANCTSRLPSQSLNWPTGSRCSKREGSQSKRNAIGKRAAGASTFEIPTAICSNSPPQAPGPYIEKTPTRWSLGASCYLCCLTRLDVLVEAEQISRIVLVFQRDQARILLLTIRCLDPSGALVGLPAEIVNVCSAGRPRLHRVPELPRPPSSFLRFGRFGAHT